MNYFINYLSLRTKRTRQDCCGGFSLRDGFGNCGNRRATG